MTSESDGSADDIAGVARELVYCTICGAPLGYGLSDQPDWPTGPMCGECYESRELDNDIAAAEELGYDF